MQVGGLGWDWEGSETASPFQGGLFFVFQCLGGFRGSVSGGGGGGL